MNHDGTVRRAVGIRAVMAQMAGAFVAFVVAPTLLPALPVAALPLLCGMVATALAWGMSLPPWWLPLEFLFAPAAATLLLLDLPGWVWLLSFIGLVLVYGGVHRSQVPLYLTGDRGRQQLLAWLPDQARGRAVDLGAGLGGVARLLARNRAGWQVLGVEHALLPWLLGWLAGLGGPGNHRMRLGDLWQLDLSGFDFIYAFLSPAPMPRMQEKLARELAPGAVFVSNGFPLPDVAPSAVASNGRHRLYLYRRQAFDHAHTRPPA